MKRRHLLASIGAASGGGALLTSTGAFTSVSADRGITVEVAGDADALLRLAPCTDGSGTEQPNAEYVDMDDDQMRIDLTDSNSPPSGDGVNPDALSAFDNVFELCNQGTQQVCVDLEADVPAIPGPVPDSYDFEAGDPAVVFYRGSTRDDFVSTSELDVDRPGAISLDVGECQCIGFAVRSYGFSSTDEIFDGAQLTTRAEAGADCEDSTTDPTPGFEQLDTELYIDEVVDNQSGQDLAADGLTGEFSRDSTQQKLSFYGFVPQSDNPNAGGGGGVELALGTASPVDLAGVEEVTIEWTHDSTSGGNATQDRSYLGVDGTRSDINRDNVENTQGEPEKSILNSNTSFGTTTDTLDVSAISSARHVGVGIQVSSNYEQFVELDIFDVWGVDSNGNRVFEFDIPGN